MEVAFYKEPGRSQRLRADADLRRPSRSAAGLRLPDSLHDPLGVQAEVGGVSLNLLTVYSLTRPVTVGVLETQAHRFDKLLTRFPVAQAEKALGKLLAEREAPPTPKAARRPPASRPRRPTPRSRSPRASR